MNLLIVVTVQVLLVLIIIGAIVYKRSANKEEPVADEQSKAEEPKEKSVLPGYSGPLTPELATFLYSHEETAIELDLELDEYESLEINEWINSSEPTPILWLTIEHDHGGTELGLFSNDLGLHVNSRSKRAVKITGLFCVDSLQGPKDGWMSVTIRSVT